MNKKAAWFSGFVLLSVAGGIIAGASNAPPPAASSAPSVSSSTAVKSPRVVAPTSAPTMTTAQQQAVGAAQGYLSDGQGFSRSSLLQQLTSSYGNGFTNADAAFAIHYLNPDWRAQAVAAAKGYLSDGEGFSRSSLLQQLTSSYGNGFTEAQAEYAVSKTGL